jgi:hypothetical protein
MGLAFDGRHQTKGHTTDEVRGRRERVTQPFDSIDGVQATIGSRGVTIRADEERRQEVPESFVILLYRLAIQGVAETDDGKLRRDVGAVDLPAEAGAEPGEEVSDVVGVCVGKEERMQGLRRNREAFDVVDGVVAFALEQPAIDGEALTAGGVIDEVGRAGNCSTGTEGLIEERRGRERVMSG